MLNGAAVVRPARRDPAALRALPGVRGGRPPASSYAARRGHGDRRPARPRAAGRPGLPNQGDGIKIGIIDDGVDQTPPVLRPVRIHDAGRLPEGPDGLHDREGDRRAGVPPPGATWQNAAQAVRPRRVGATRPTSRGSPPATPGRRATGGAKVSGVAPRAYIGNYKALTVPTDAASASTATPPEIVAAIEAAVADGMNVINLSIGEPEVEPPATSSRSRSTAAAGAGVVPVVAAGNDFEEFGAARSARPGRPTGAITVAAVSSPDDTAATAVSRTSAARGRRRSRCGSSPTSAPRASAILSSIPGGGWAADVGDVDGDPAHRRRAALLLERHPAWTVAELKAALIGSGSPVAVGGAARAADARRRRPRESCPRPTSPLVLASPASVSFGLVQPGGAHRDRRSQLTDAGGGAGNGASPSTRSAAADGGDASTCRRR